MNYRVRAIYLLFHSLYSRSAPATTPHFGHTISPCLAFGTAILPLAGSGSRVGKMHLTH